jgi:Kef-type K+ transport system membrane component KefB/mannitol/fructose-specific phosphotransferase system IIA component (Ntr-type)
MSYARQGVGSQVGAKQTMRTWLAVVMVLGAPVAVQAAEGAAATAMTQRMAVLALQLGVLLFATRAGSLCCQRLRLPGVLGQLAAGVVLGPFVLGAVPLPGFPTGLFPPAPGFPVGAELYGLSSLAAVLLLFAAGLATDTHLFVRHAAAGTAVGVGGALVAFVVGDLMGVLLGAGLLDRPMGFTAAPCLFLGVVSAATAVGVTARVLAAKGRLDSPEGVTTLGAAGVGDVLAMLALAGVLGVASAGRVDRVGWSHVTAAAARAVGIWLLAAVAGVLLARRIGDLLRRLHGRTAMATMALGLALVVGGLFEEAGLAAVIGAYVMGLALSRTDLAHLIRERLDPLYVLLVPVFFAVTGMLVDVRACADPRILVVAFLFTLAAVLAKVVGGGAPALLLGFTGRGALRIGVGLVPRGEIALVVAGVGLAAGALPQDFFGVAVLMTVLTALCTPPLLAALFRRDDAGIRRPELRPSPEVIRFPCGSPRQAEWILDGLRDTLSRDGFFVHVLEHEGGAVLALRGKASIAFRQDQHDVVFTCEPSAVPVVKTAVLYVVRELHATLEGMRRPLDVHRVLGRTPSAPAGSEGHDVKPYLRPDLVKLRLKGTAGPELLAELVALVDAAGLVQNKDEVLAALVAREQSLSTGLERGIAVPHCRTDAVSRLVCAIGLKPEGVDFGAFDGQPSRVFVLTLSPISDPTPHVQFMSQMVQVLTPNVCRRLLRAESTHEVIAILSARSEPEPSPNAGPAAPRQPVPHAIRANALTDAVMVPRLRAGTKEEAIEELLEALAAVHPIGDLAQVRRQLFQREQVMSTGFERGIAVPHCRTGAVNRVYCALGLKPEGLDFGSQDGTPAQIIVLILASTSMPTPYAQTLALLLHALNRTSRTQLLACTDAAALHAMILQAVEGAGDAKG